MPLMIPPRVGAQLRALPVSPRVGFWAIAAITLVLAWPLRRSGKRGSVVLAGSLLVTAWYFMTVR
jgi:hypothetical protein